MTEEELAPFVGRTVAVYNTAGNAVTGILRHADSLDVYHVHSVDGEVPPVAFLPEEIVKIIA